MRFRTFFYRDFLLFSLIIDTKQFQGKINLVLVSHRQEIYHLLVALYIYTEIFTVPNVGSVKYTHFAQGPYINNDDSFRNCLVKRNIITRN